MKKTLLRIWNWSYNLFRQLEYFCLAGVDAAFCLFWKAPVIASIDETINRICVERCSASRFGDGEIKLIAGRSLAFQKCSPDLQTKLIEVLEDHLDGLLVCLPDVFGSLSCFEDSARRHWKEHLSIYRRTWYHYLIPKVQYYNSFISRFYMMYKDKDSASLYFDHIRKIWNNRNILLVEGEKSRVGVGNDLFDGAKSINRILAPNKDAFDYYDLLLKKVLEQNPQEYLVLLALGPTATVLAYDLTRLGYQAVDIGHIDIEYEWYLTGAKTKVPVNNKFVNEAGFGKGVGSCSDEKYCREIIWHY